MVSVYEFNKKFFKYFFRNATLTEENQELCKKDEEVLDALLDHYKYFDITVLLQKRDEQKYNNFLPTFSRLELSLKKYMTDIADMDYIEPFMHTMYLKLTNTDLFAISFEIFNWLKENTKIKFLSHDLLVNFFEEMLLQEKFVNPLGNYLSGKIDLEECLNTLVDYLCVQWNVELTHEILKEFFEE